MRRGIALAAFLIAAVVSAVAVTRGGIAPVSDDRLQGAFRKPAVSGWTFVHVQGTPAQIGYQHGYLLSVEIADLENVYKLELAHDNGKGWNFFRDAAKNAMWPRIDQEYRDELQGIADGVAVRGVKMDLWDVVAMNAAEEWSYYVGQYDKDHNISSPSTVVAPDHCSAFVATGSYTKDGKIVIAHNDWTGYLDGSRWTIVLDVVPAKGYRFIMDTLPGFIHSGDDFAVNSAGIIITETTITGFSGYDFNGIPEFIRARKAEQYSSSTDEVANNFKEGNNGGYANDWLIGDTRKNEIASLELGLKNVTLENKSDGYFVRSQFSLHAQIAFPANHFHFKKSPINR